MKFSKFARRFGNRLTNLNTHEICELTGVVEFPTEPYGTIPSGGHDPYNHAGWQMLARDEYGRISRKAQFQAFANKGY